MIIIGLLTAGVGGGMRVGWLIGQIPHTDFMSAGQPALEITGVTDVILSHRWLRKDRTRFFSSQAP